MSRSIYNTGTPFLFTNEEPLGTGMDCLQLQPQSGPFHYLISEQAKSLVALQELQNEVGALLEFRDLVMETFPNLRTKLATSSPVTMTTSQHHINNQHQQNQHHHVSNIPVSVRAACDWTPGIRIRKKISNKDDTRINKKIGDLTVQDSGFSTETSSKETHSASSTALPPSSAAGVHDIEEAEDELWSLLDIIHRKGTRLKEEVDALQGTLRGTVQEDNDFQQVLFNEFSNDIRQLHQERNDLLDRLAEMEAEVLASRIHTTRLQEDLENLLITKHELEEQLKEILTQSGKVNNTRINNLHYQFVDKNDHHQTESITLDSSQQRLSECKNNKNLLDLVMGDQIPKVKVPNSKKIAAILKESDPIVLKKHLLTTTVQNQVLHHQLDTAARLEMGLIDKLDKVKEENDELRFQLDDKNIELEGTRARIRLLEQFQKSLDINSPDVIPSVNNSPDIEHAVMTRSEITTASMKAMSPLPLNLQMDHSSSTESAHDQAENNRKGLENNNMSKRKPSKIPLKSYSAPKPPGGKHSPAPTARSRSGESPGRPHSAQSWRNRSEGNSLLINGGNKNNTSLTKSRNGSLISAKDSLTSKLRSSDSFSKLSSSPNNNNNSNNKNNCTINNNNSNSNFGININNTSRSSTLRKTNNPKWTNSYKDSMDKVRTKSSSIWNFFRSNNAQT